VQLSTKNPASKTNSDGIGRLFLYAGEFLILEMRFLSFFVNKDYSLLKILLVVEGL